MDRLMMPGQQGRSPVTTSVNNLNEWRMESGEWKLGIEALEVMLNLTLIGKVSSSIGVNYDTVT